MSIGNLWGLIDLLSDVKNAALTGWGDPPTLDFGDKPKSLRYPEDLISIDSQTTVWDSSRRSVTGTPYILFELYDDYVELDLSVFEDNPKKSYNNVTANREKRLMKTKHTIALYMTPSVSINDNMSYDTETRAIMEAASSMEGTWDGISAAATAANKKFNEVNPLGEEYQRLTGRVYNPNEYLFFRSAQLRSFGFQFKFLPNSENESRLAEDIIKTFRSLMRPEKLGDGVTQRSPYKCRVSFQNVSDMLKIGPSYITSATVNYNPNSASFFRNNGSPVEVDFSISLQEIFPIFKDDVETGGM